jgi:hypothetical protein
MLGPVPEAIRLEIALLRCVYVAENTHSGDFGIASGTGPSVT